jgi:N-acetylneuraminate synthase
MEEYIKPKVISEIGCNHMGDFDIAKELVLMSKEAGADIVKLQKRNNKELLTDEQYNQPHPNPNNSYGNTYGAHREFLEFDFSKHKELMEYCESIGIEYSTSTWDTTSAKEIASFNPRMIKVPSACNLHFEMLKVLRDDYKGEVHISMGMTTKHEEEEIISFFEETNQAKSRLIIYACTSGYPVPFDDVCLLELVRMIERHSIRVKEIGFSGHHLGIGIDIAAYTLGATYIERHFTKDRSWKGTDHAASLEFPGLQKLTRNLEQTFRSMTLKSEDILDIEKVQREKLKYRK